MYEWVTHTWNVVKGACYHDCSYCYMKRFGKLNPCRFDEKELKTNLGNGNYIFVGSSCDMFAEYTRHEWVCKTLEYCSKYDNKYLFQTKNPASFLSYFRDYNILPENSTICTTIETDKWFPQIMNKSPFPHIRAANMALLKHFDKYVTIEPIMDFDLYWLVVLIKTCNPIQVNIGADSGNNNLPEPPKEKILELISELEKFTKVKLKKNLDRLIK